MDRERRARTALDSLAGRPRAARGPGAIGADRATVPSHRPTAVRQRPASHGGTAVAREGRRFRLFASRRARRQGAEGSRHDPSRRSCSRIASASSIGTCSARAPSGATIYTSEACNAQYRLPRAGSASRNPWARTRCDTASPRTCSSAATTSAPCRSCSAIRTCPPHRSTRT